MKDGFDIIRRLSLKEVIALTGSGTGGEFHIFETKKEAFEIQKFKPARFDYYTLLLVTSGEFNIRLNLSDHCVRQNELLIIPSGIVHDFHSISIDCQFTGIGFTRQFMGETGLHKKIH